MNKIERLNRLHHLREDQEAMHDMHCRYFAYNLISETEFASLTKKHEDAMLKLAALEDTINAMD